MFALIFENKVADIANQTFPVIPTMEWIECNSSVKIGWLFVDGIFKESNLSDSEILKNAKNQKIAQCLAYLSSTDWQVIRLADPSSGEALKEGVAENRILARSLQDDIEACTTLEQLNNINVNFE